MNLDEAATAFREFAAVIKALRTPGSGCPWDLEQTHRTLRPFLIEEAYETLEAIDSGDDPALCDELGDLLLQVVLHAQLADDRGGFSITEVIRGIAAKMVRRHPHVFAGAPVAGSSDVIRNWDEIKAAEARAAGRNPSAASSLARIPQSLPALLRAQKLAEKAAKLQPEAQSPSLDRVRDEFAQLEGAIRAEASQTQLERQLGDLLFRLCQLARQLGVNAEDSLRTASQRFVEEFQFPAAPYIE